MTKIDMQMEKTRRKNTNLKLVLLSNRVMNSFFFSYKKKCVSVSVHVAI